MLNRHLAILFLFLMALAVQAQTDSNTPPMAMTSTINLHILTAESLAQAFIGGEKLRVWLPVRPGWRMTRDAFFLLPDSINRNDITALNGVNAVSVRVKAPTMEQCAQASNQFSAAMNVLDSDGGAGVLDLTLLKMARVDVIAMLTNWAPDAATVSVTDILQKDWAGPPSISGIRQMKGRVGDYLATLPKEKTVEITADARYLFPLMLSPTVRAVMPGDSLLKFRAMKGVGEERLLFLDAFAPAPVLSPLALRLTAVPDRPLLLGILTGVRKFGETTIPVITPLINNTLDGYDDTLTLVILTYTRLDTQPKPTLSPLF